MQVPNNFNKYIILLHILFDYLPKNFFVIGLSGYNIIMICLSYIIGTYVIPKYYTTTMQTYTLIIK